MSAPALPTAAGRDRLLSFFLTLATLVLAAAMLLPIIWMLFTAFKPEADVVTAPPELFPRELTLEHFAGIWTRLPFAQLYLNTILFAGAVTIISLVFDSMAAYALARLRFRGSTVVFIVILLVLMMPYQVTLIPLYDQLSALGLTNSVIGMVLPRMTNAFGIFLMRQFFLSLPRDLEDAARIDGASEWRIFWRVIMPLARPAVLTLGLFHFQYNWNDLLWPLIMADDMSSATLPAGLALFMGQNVVEYGLLMAGSVLSLAPVVIAFLLVQRRFVVGIATTGMK